MILMRQCKLFTNLLIILLFLLPVHLSQQWHHENNNNLHPDSQSGLQILINCKPNYASETDFMFLLFSGDPRASLLEAYFFSLQGYSNPPEIKGRKKKKKILGSRGEGEKRIVRERERKEEREMKQSPHILLCALPTWIWKNDVFSWHFLLAVILKITKFSPEVLLCGKKHKYY